jgi:hypothetical protein
MTTLKTNAIEPEGGTTNLTVGMTGQNVVIGGSGGIKANTFKDAGGNTLWTSNGSGTVTGVSLGSVVLISSQTASNSASLSFTSGIDSTYKEYVFEFFNINPATDAATFQFQVNVSGQSGFNETMTTTDVHAYNSETLGTGLQYYAGFDQAEGIAYQTLADDVGNGADESCAGELHLFNPSSTTYVKHFYSRASSYHWLSRAESYQIAGYINVTGAVDEISFKMDSGNFDGTIKMYGIN